MLMQGVTSSCKFKPARRRARVGVLLAVAHVVVHLMLLNGHQQKLQRSYQLTTRAVVTTQLTSASVGTRHLRCIYTTSRAIPLNPTTGIWLFAECHILCRVFFFGHSAKKLFAECHAKNTR
jgi:hypothetical protein